MGSQVIRTTALLVVYTNIQGCAYADAEDWQNNQERMSNKVIRNWGEYVMMTTFHNYSFYRYVEKLDVANSVSCVRMRIEGGKEAEAGMLDADFKDEEVGRWGLGWLATPFHYLRSSPRPASARRRHCFLWGSFWPKWIQSIPTRRPSSVESPVSLRPRLLLLGRVLFLFHFHFQLELGGLKPGVILCLSSSYS